MLEYFMMVMEGSPFCGMSKHLCDVTRYYLRYRERCHVITPNRRSNSPKRMLRQDFTVHNIVDFPQCT